MTTQLAERPAAVAVPARYRWVPPLLALAGIGCWVGFVRGVDPGRLGSLGLVTALHPAVLAGIVLLSLAFCAELRSPAPRTAVLVATCLAAVLCLYGIQPLTEPVARLPVAWLHAGWAQQIVQHGTVLHDFDARFSWPAFFAAIAFLVSGSGAHDATGLLAWTPPVFTGLAAIGVHALAAAVLGRGRGAWLATWLFLLVDWVEQDYFSPQGASYLLYVAALALTVRWLCRPGLTVPAGWSLPWRRPPYPRPATGARHRLAAALGVVLLICALSPTHQVTPFALAMLLVLLALAGRLYSPWLAVLAVAIPATWLVLGASEYWLGHLDVLFGGIGDVSGSVQQNVGQRFTGDLGRTAVLGVRVALTGLVLIAAAWGWWSLRRPRPGNDATPGTTARPGNAARSGTDAGPERGPRSENDARAANDADAEGAPGTAARSGNGRRPVLLAVLAVAPFALLALQSYGGEMLLRSLLYALPLLCTVAGAGVAALLTRAGRPGAVLAGFVALVLGAASLGLVTARGGNDAYVAFRTADVAAVREAYRVAPAGGTIAALTAYVPLDWQRVGRISQKSLERQCRPGPHESGCVRHAAPDLLIVSRAQDNYGVILLGLRRGWTGTVVADLLRSGDYRERLRDGDTVLLEHVSTGGGR